MRKRFMLIGVLLIVGAIGALLRWRAHHQQLGGQKQGTVELTILGIGDRPASGATVVLLPPRGIRMYIFTGDLNPAPYPDTPQFQAGLDGVVALPAISGSQGVVAFGADGYAELDPQIVVHGGTVRLQPWARVVGRLRIGDRAGVDQTVQAQMASRRYASGKWQMISFIKAHTDSDGRFTIERVPPGEMSVCRLVINSAGSNYGTQSQDVDLAPGQTATVNLGGMGRQILGRVDLPATLAGRQHLFWNCQIAHIEKPPRLPMPDDILNSTAEQRRAWTAGFLKTDAGKAWKTASNTAFYAFVSYPAEMQPDGTFRIEDVAAGAYNLDVQILDQGSPVAIPPEVASGTLPFVVPPMPAGRSDEPLQLSVLQLQNTPATVPVLTAGDIAPAFDLPTLDGGKIHLSDFRGKFVLLDFWGLYCTPCVETMLKLRNVNDAFAKTGQLVIIGMDTGDADLQKPLAFVRRQKIPWAQAWLGGDAAQPTRDRYYSDGSGLWLIGPDGKVIAKDLPSEQVTIVIAKAMKQ